MVSCAEWFEINFFCAEIQGSKLTFFLSCFNCPWDNHKSCFGCPVQSLGALNYMIFIKAIAQRTTTAHIW